MNSTLKKLGYLPEAILINIPESYFLHGFNMPSYFQAPNNYKRYKKEREQHKARREAAFRRFYETMHKRSDQDCFYHFISSCPAEEIAKNIQFVYVCFQGFVQYKALLVEFRRNQAIDEPNYKHPEPRDWCITTGPVVKAPEGFAQQGFRGFRYTKDLF